MKKFMFILLYCFIILLIIVLTSIAIYFVFLIAIQLYCDITWASTDWFMGLILPMIFLIIISAIIILVFAAIAMRQALKNKECSVPLLGKMARKFFYVNKH